MATMKLANEAYKLVLNYGEKEPEVPTKLISARADSAAFQVILNSENPYSVSVGTSEWFSASNFPITRLPHERLRIAVEAPFKTKLSIEEFVKDDDGVEKADILLNSDTRDSMQNVPSAVFVEIEIPEDATPGAYDIKVKLYSSLYTEDEKLVGEETLSLVVYPYVLPNYKDWKFHLDLWQHNSNIARHYDVRLWSDEHFAVIEKVVKSLAKLGQKSITVCVSEIPWSGQACTERPLYGGNMFEYSIVKITKKKNGEFVFDYSNMQRYIDLCTEAGFSGDIEVFGLVNLWVKSDLGTPSVDYVEPIRLRYFDESDGTCKYVSDSETVENYIRSLEKYFIETDQLSRVRIAADEPADMEKYRKSLNIIKSIAPAFRYKTAINHAEFIDEFGDAIDDFVPYLYCVCEKYDVLKEYQKKLAGKRFLWYVCCGEGRPNTQLRQHLTESRMIGPMNYHLGFDGFLRWSYTIWPDDPRKDIRYARFESGDTALVYPAYNGDVLLSLRYKNLQRGIADYELLRALADKGAGDEARAFTESLLETCDLAEYYKTSYSTLRGAHTHSWEDFNNMKQELLIKLSENK